MKEMILKIWKKWFGKKAEQVVNVKEKQVSPMLEKLENCLFGKYDFRFNVLTEQTEYRKKCEGVFHMVDQRVLYESTQTGYQLLGQGCIPFASFGANTRFSSVHRVCGFASRMGRDRPCIGIGS